jgi:hypothetical protein
MTRIRAYELEPLLDRGVKVCQDLGLKPGALYVIAYRAGLHLDRGRWNEAATDATTVLTDVSSVPLLRLQALTVLGLVRARRGDPQQWAPLDEALALLEDHDELRAGRYRAPPGPADPP